MVKRKSILIMGVVLLGIVSALGATLALLGTGVVGGSAQPLVFASASVEVEYTGNAVTSDKFEITSGKLKDGHTAYADMSGTQTEAGTSDNAFTITVLDERGNDVTDEYEFDCVYGKLTVLPRKLELKSGDGSKVYDGTELKIESATVADGTLAARTLIMAGDLPAQPWGGIPPFPAPPDRVRQPSVLENFGWQTLSVPPLFSAFCRGKAWGAGKVFRMPVFC